MRTYARIDGGAVAELFATDQDISELFHPSLHWVDVTGRQVEPGWIMQPNGFVPPPPAPAPQPLPPTVAELHAQVAELAARVAALAKT